MMADVTAETGKMNIGTILRNYDSEIRSTIRKTEKIWKKIKSKKMSVVFNELCIYIYIYYLFCNIIVPLAYTRYLEET